MSEQFPWQGKNRRKTPRSHDKFYQIVLAMNIVAWMIFVASLIVFHYARPELMSGVQEYWGVSGREDWAMSLSIYLVILLCLCTSMSAFVLFMRRYRTRRRNDYFGINVVILLAFSLVVLIWILSDL